MVLWRNCGLTIVITVTAGKLFPGPHLYAGAMITVLWGLSAALVPAMQKGNDNARTAHIALNTVNLLLFASQVSAVEWHTHSWYGLDCFCTNIHNGI